MSILKNLLGTFMPHFEQRRTTGSLNNNGAEVVHEVNGDTSTLISLSSASTLTCTYNIQGSVDGTTWFDILAFPIPQACVGSTIPQACQPLVTESFASVNNVQRCLSISSGQLVKIRVRLTTWSVGSISVTINSDDCLSFSPYVRDQKSSSLSVSATDAVSTAVTATLPAAPSLRHYIDRISVTRSATSALTTSTTPVLVTTTNIPGSPTITFGSDAGGVGNDIERVLEFGGAGIACTSINKATTIVCPAWTGVIWRINVAYRLGL